MNYDATVAAQPHSIALDGHFDHRRSEELLHFQRVLVRLIEVRGVDFHAHVNSMAHGISSYRMLSEHPRHDEHLIREEEGFPREAEAGAAPLEGEVRV